MALSRRWFQFSLRGFLVVLTIGCLWLGWLILASRPLYVDAHGQVHGTGLKRYFYRNGAVKLEEQYKMGDLLLSRWFRPDGKVIATTHWKNGDGLMIGLDEEGQIKARIPIRAGKAEGWGDYYGVDGKVEKRVKFAGGVKIDEELIRKEAGVLR